MSALAYALFDTALGPCAIAWSERGVVAVQLPDQSRDSTRRRLSRRYPGLDEASPPEVVSQAISRISRLLEGAADDLRDIALDLDDASDFERAVWAAAGQIPFGQTVTYGELARTVGDPGAARAVGVALGRNPVPIIVPCHRILAADGGFGGFSAPGGLQSKARLLNIERAWGGEPLLFTELPLAART